MVRLALALGLVLAVIATAELQQSGQSPSVELVESPPVGFGAVSSSAGRAGWEDVYDDLLAHEDQGRVYRVRETVFAPLPRSTASSTPSTAVAPAGLPTPAPHITKTLRPLFTYFIHHPVRATIKVAPYVARGALASLKLAARAGFRLARLVVVTLYALFATPTLVVLKPFFWTYRVAVALQAVWLTALGAILAGSGIGALAGLVSATQVRSALNRWSGRAGANPRQSELRCADGPPARAKLERVDDKGKRKAMDGFGFGREPYYPLDGAGVPEPAWYDPGTPRAAARSGDWRRPGGLRDDGDAALDDFDSGSDYDDDTVRAPGSRAGSGCGSGGSKSSSASSDSSSAPAPRRAKVEGERK